jgi:hypothetical protein
VIEFLQLVDFFFLLNDLMVLARIDYKGVSDGTVGIVVGALLDVQDQAQDDQRYLFSIPVVLLKFDKADHFENGGLMDLNSQ